MSHLIEPSLNEKLKEIITKHKGIIPQKRAFIENPKSSFNATNEHLTEYLGLLIE
jgi:hypothetical protein